MTLTEVQLPSKRMIAAVQAFVARHPEYRAQVYHEWIDHLEQEPFLTQEKELIGYERGLLPVDIFDPLSSQQEVVDYGSYRLTGRTILAWQDL